MGDFFLPTAQDVSSLRSISRWAKAQTNKAGPGSDPQILPDCFCWCILLSDLVAGGEANANEAVWYVLDAGDYTLDLSETVKVRDTTGMQSASAGDWIFCRKLASDNGLVREAIIGGGGAGGTTIRTFCLVTNLAEGGTATCRDLATGILFEAYDPHGEFSGKAGVSGGFAYSNSVEDGSGGGSAGGSGLWTIGRMTCRNFQSIACSAGS
jgi:hypothetical protein